jgi:toxin ParE1/3/4
MPAYRLAAAARRDLAEIREYIARDSAESADRWIGALIDRFRMLARIPYAGRSRDEVRPGLRSFAVGEYLIFYLARKPRIEIVRVVHGRRRLERLSFGR